MPAIQNRQSLPVRFTPAQENAIERLAEENAISRAEVVRLAVEQFLAQLDDKGEMTVSRVIKAAPRREGEARARGRRTEKS